MRREGERGRDGYRQPNGIMGKRGKKKAKTKKSFLFPEEILHASEDHVLLKDSCTEFIQSGFFHEYAAVW